MWIVILQSLIIISILMVLAFALTRDVKETSRNIAVYSGSFNPLHIGHKAVIDALSKRYDKVYLIVTPQNPLKEKTLIPSEERVKNAEKVLLKNEYFNVVVNNIEDNMLPPYYTVNTLRELRKQSSNDVFTLAIGADNLTSIKKWKEYQEILTDFGVIVFPRGAEDVGYLENLKNRLLNEDSRYKIEIENTITPTISSTEIRDAIARGENVSNLLM